MIDTATCLNDMKPSKATDQALCPLCFSGVRVKIGKHERDGHDLDGSIPILRNGRLYLHCQSCDLRFLAPKDQLSPQAEKNHYLCHKNDVHDPGYQAFVKPLFDRILSLAPADSCGLDYGCGTGPVLTHQLRQRGWDVSLFDPYFHPAQETLTRTYDFIFCCEVVEHFNNPRQEFQTLFNLLKPGGFLAFMTSLYREDLDFNTWHYAVDPTHVAFYSEACLQSLVRIIGYTDVWTDRFKLGVLFR